MMKDIENMYRHIEKENSCIRIVNGLYVFYNEY